MKGLGIFWNGDRGLRAEKMFLEGTSYLVIAEKLGTTRNAVAGYLVRRGIKREKAPMARANIELNIYDPVRIQLLDDIVERLISPAKGDEATVRMDAMVIISRLRSVIATIAPPGSSAQAAVKAQVRPEEFNMIYWSEYSANEYRRLAERRKLEESAVEWMGA